MAAMESGYTLVTAAVALLGGTLAGGVHFIKAGSRAPSAFLAFLALFIGIAPAATQDVARD